MRHACDHFGLKNHHMVSTDERDHRPVRCAHVLVQATASRL
jgi:hypothetical protein